MKLEDDYSEMSVVTEIGVFGELDVEDPTATRVKKKKDANLEDTINEAIMENMSNLSNL